MLVRRFTIVCMLAALFGMFFAALVAQSDTSRVVHASGQMVRCSYIQTFACRS